MPFLSSGKKSLFGVLALAAPALFLASPVLAQDDWTKYVGRFDVYGGYEYLGSPSIGLSEHGFDVQGGVNVTPWLAAGFDFSRTSGSTNLGASVLTGSLQQELNTIVSSLISAGLLPPNYKLSLKTSSETNTFAAGPELVFRHFSRVVLFARPALGAVHETATPYPHDALTKLAVTQLAPTGHKEDWTVFYGFGGGADLLLNKHFSIRFQADMLHDHLFSDLLRNGRNSIRFSVGPAIRFGKNIRK